MYIRIVTRSSAAGGAWPLAGGGRLEPRLESIQLASQVEVKKIVFYNYTYMFNITYIYIYIYSLCSKTLQMNSLLFCIK